MLLSAQEKQAKKASQQAFSEGQIQKEKKQKREDKINQSKRAASSAAHQEAQFKKAEKKLLDARGKLNKAKNAVEVEGSFEKGYFKARGMAQEKQVKEVKLKKMALKHRDYVESREAEKKTGEFSFKKRKQEHDTMVLTQELKIETSKERLVKLKNERMRHELNDQSVQFADLQKDEVKEMKKLEENHKRNIKRLQRTVQKLDERIGDENEELKAADQVAEATKSKGQKELEQSQKLHETLVRDMRTETQKIVEAIVMSASSKNKGNKNKPA